MIRLVVLFLLLRPAFVHCLCAGGCRGVRLCAGAGKGFDQTRMRLGDQGAGAFRLRAGIRRFRGCRLAAGGRDGAHREKVGIGVIAFAVFVFRQRDIFLVKRLRERIALR